MNYFIFFTIAGLLNLILVSIVFYTKPRIQNSENKIYSYLIWITLVGCLIEISMLFTCRLMDSFPIINTISSKGFLIMCEIWITMLTIYTMSVSYKSKNVDAKKRMSKYKLLFLILFIAIGSTIFLPIDYYFEKGSSTYLYTYGLSTKVVFLMAIICISINLFIIIANKELRKSKKVYPIYAYIIISSFVSLLQQIEPSIILISFVECLIIFLMYHTIENPDVKMIEQLELARDAADKANAAKTDFLSSMSHEIRTPLNAIVGFSDCIKNSNDLADAKENADDIINASNTLLEIVNGILDISKIEAGKLEIINSNYNANNLFSGLAKLMTPKMNEKGLDFQVTIAPDLPNVLYGDSANIKKVVTNLLSNAYKYTDSGFVKYDVKCVNTNGICRLIVTVSDSGRGIKKESIDKLFTKFQRVDEYRNTTIEGTGLGLAITKQLVELMGGTVVVDSIFGEGSKFTITLDQRIENVAVVEEKTFVDNIDLNGRKILVVDDNAINLKVARKLLERYNATVEVCDSGFKCIDLINSGASFDLILMDDMMPKMSGTQTLKKLKENSSFNIPVFALTANAITGMKERYLEAGFDSYLAKPIEKEAMINEFNKLFSGKSLVTEEKKEEIVEESVKANSESTNDIVKNVEYLKSNNIDVEHGLELLGDIELYNDTMNDFIDEVIKRLPLLDEYKNNSDMPNYAILVHAIKSDCKYLGIMSLADINYEHELKSKANDVDFVNSNYDNLISEINKYLDICKKYTGRD